jgi:hypothetical protein
LISMEHFFFKRSSPGWGILLVTKTFIRIRCSFPDGEVII